MSKPKKIEEISIDLAKHDVEIISKAGSYVKLKIDGINFPTPNVSVDGIKIKSLKRIDFTAPYFNGLEDEHKKMLQVIVGY